MAPSFRSLARPVRLWLDPNCPRIRFSLRTIRRSSAAPLRPARLALSGARSPRKRELGLRLSVRDVSRRRLRRMV